MEERALLLEDTVVGGAEELWIGELRNFVSRNVLSSVCRD